MPPVLAQQLKILTVLLPKPKLAQRDMSESTLWWRKQVPNISRNNLSDSTDLYLYQQAEKK